MRAYMGAPLTSWPWENLGSYKYVLYGPLLAKAIVSRVWESGSPDRWLAHLVLLFALRALTYQLWASFSGMLFANRRRRIVRDGVDYEQIDREWHWDDFLILQFWATAMAFYASPSSLRQLPLWDGRGAAVAVLCHVAATEPLFYLLHRALHGSGFLFGSYHSLRHSARVPHPFTAGLATPLEHLAVSALMAAPLAAAWAAGLGSVRLLFGYTLVFDSLRAMAHCNVEVFPSVLFQATPAVRYLIATPTYHTIHHTDKDTNFCLFMPLFDLLGGTMNDKSWELQRKTSAGIDDEVPGFVFLAHVVDLSQSLHAHFVFRSYASTPYAATLALAPLWPGAFTVMLAMWAWSKTFLVSSYKLRGRLHQLWVVPRHGFHYFLPFAKDGINRQIELAILRADKMGVKVLSLAALNKNEALNGGGTLFVDKYPELRVRVVHGNTLTAAVILREIPEGTAEVFLTGATSKLGRAIALYLSRKRVRVMMLTASAERFQKIQKEAAPEDQQYLVQVTKYQSGQNCKTWIVGKWLTPREQRWAPAGTHFHQFVVPPAMGFRRDCTYGKLAAMRLPGDVQGLGTCEYSLERGVVHACHAGGLVHFLEGYEHHEVGAIDVDRIDAVWEAALRHGLRAV